MDGFVDRRGFLSGSAVVAVASGLAGWGCVSRLVPERPLLTVGILTDTHVLDADDSCERVGDALRLFRAREVDLVAHVGDLADRFYRRGYAAYRAKFDSVFAGTVKRPREAYVFAAHDAFSYPDASRHHAATYEQAHEAFEAMKAILKVPHDMDDVLEVGGFPFVICSQWLQPQDYERRLERVVADHPGVPVFVLDHLPPFDTVGNSFFWGNDQRRRILDRFPQVVHISGHNHASIRDERSFWQGEFTAVNAGSMSYWGCRGDAVGGDITGDGWQRVEAFDALLMEVYVDRIVFRRFDVRDGSEYRPDSPWTARMPHAVRDGIAAGAARRREERVPRFPAGAKVSLRPDGNGGSILSFPEAVGDVRAWQYRVDLLQRDGGNWLPYARQDFFGDFFRREADRTGVAERTICGAFFAPDSDHLVRVTPIGQFGCAGTPIETVYSASAAAAWRPVFTSTRLGDGWKVSGNAWTWKTEPAIRPGEDGWFSCGEKRRYWSVEPELPANAARGERFAVVVEAELESIPGRPFHVALDNPFGTATVSVPGKAPWQRYLFEFAVRESGERHAVLFCAMGPSRFRPKVVRLFRYTGTDRAASIPTEDLRVRDPFIVTDAAAGKYRLYASRPWQGGNGVDVYESRDLKSWTGPTRVMTVPEGFACRSIWAPEVHAYRGKWYLFVTLTAAQDEIRPGLPRRGTRVFVSDSPEGPFVPTRQGSVTPEDWSALDGTFFEEGGKPYMVFCHEWCQTGDGRMMLAELTDGLDGFVGEPVELFTATSVGEGRCVTDGPCLYRSPKGGRLFMTWSNRGPKGYAVYLNESESGHLAGPWRNRGMLFEDDGGHGAFFRRLDGSLAFALHRPNNAPDERLKVFAVRDDGTELKLEKVER